MSNPRISLADAIQWEKEEMEEQNERKRKLRLSDDEAHEEKARPDKLTKAVPLAPPAPQAPRAPRLVAKKGSTDDQFIGRPYPLPNSNPVTADYSIGGSGFFMRRSGTDLQKAAARNDVTMLRALLNHEKNVKEIDNRDLSGITALWFATSRGHVESVELLLQRGASIFEKSYNIDEVVGSPLSLLLNEENPIPNRQQIWSLFSDHVKQAKSSPSIQNS